MKAIILAAGYATRLRPLTDSWAKELLPVGGRPIVDRILDAIESSGAIDDVHVVTNARKAAWFEEWAHDALGREGRYLTDRDPTAYLDGTVPELMARFAAARARYRERIAALDEESLGRALSYFGRYDVTERELLRTHALHLAGHRFQVRYVRGTYSRAHGTRKADFDPW